VVDIPAHLKGRHFLRVADWSAGELTTLLELAAELKGLQGARVAHAVLPARTLAMIFDKPSTRTRLSFAAGMVQLGGVGLPIATGETQLGRGETLRDTALILSRFVDGLVIRTFSQADVEELAAHASIPVINGLTDDFHPCQAIADALTIRERFGRFAGVRLAYVGDGNNVCHSLMTICALLGVGFVAATPTGYEPRSDVLELAHASATAAGSELRLVSDPVEAVRGADVVYTDVWTSMGQDAEAEKRRRAFAGYRVDDELLAHAPDAVVMHDLPAHYGEEITEEVLHGPRSIAWDQAENRLHAQKALLALVVS
jgi:ornithine carbamoyltransferase